jgi:ubiquinone/menaquinone biosynthesis C-methylase UbiE
MTGPERAYYERRAPEYDDWWLGTGLYRDRDRPGWHEEVEALRSLLRSLSIRSVLDVACGTGFLTQHLPGRAVGVDQSRAMLEIAQSRLPRGEVIQGDAFHLPFCSNRFECLMASHFYGHLAEPDRSRFLTEARRIAGSLLVVDAAVLENVPAEAMQERVLKDGSRHSVYKRYFTPSQLIAELGGARVLHAGRWFVAALAYSQE